MTQTCPGRAQSLTLPFFLPSPGKADLSAVRGLSSAMGIGMSLLLQFSLTSGGYRSVGRSRRCSRSIPRNIPRRSWKKPHPQLCSLQAEEERMLERRCRGPTAMGPAQPWLFFWALPGVLPAQERVEVPGQISSTARRPGPRQGPSLCPLSEAFPRLGGPVASHSAVPGPTASALP